jgi:metal-responsive CopG/Arc/MetJ family transcriptional regulator
MSLALSKNKKKDRLSFFVDTDLSNKINQISKQTNLSASEIARNALQNYIEQIEKEKIEKELEYGYKANSSYYIKSQKEWEYADKE